MTTCQMPNHRMSNSQAVGLALLPGVAEYVARRAEGEGNIAWLGMANRVTNARNVLYFGVVLTIIAAAGAALATTGAFVQYACGSFVFLGGCLSAVAAVALYDVTVRIQTFINGRRQS